MEPTRLGRQLRWILQPLHGLIQQPVRRVRLLFSARAAWFAICDDKRVDSESLCLRQGCCHSRTVCSCKISISSREISGHKRRIKGAMRVNKTTLITEDGIITRLQIRREDISTIALPNGHTAHRPAAPSERSSHPGAAAPASAARRCCRCGPTQGRPSPRPQLPPTAAAAPQLPPWCRRRPTACPVRPCEAGADGRLGIVLKMRRRQQLLAYMPMWLGGQPQCICIRCPAQVVRNSNTSPTTTVRFATAHERAVFVTFANERAVHAFSMTDDAPAQDTAAPASSASRSAADPRQRRPPLWRRVLPRPSAAARPSARPRPAAAVAPPRCRSPASRSERVGPKTRGEQDTSSQHMSH